MSYRERMQRWSRRLLNLLGTLGQRLYRLYHPKTLREKGVLWGSGLALLTWLVVVIVLGLYWSGEPEPFNVQANAASEAQRSGGPVVTGYVTTATLIRLSETLLDKPGGYLYNDMFPPGLYLDNIPNWEFGVVVQVRDMSRALRNDFSRSQSQSVEDPDLIAAEPQFNFDNDSWLIPSTEGEYREGIEAMRRYLGRLNDTDEGDAQFYARADNLVAYLAQVEKRLGSLSQRLSASVGEQRLNTDLAGDAAATQSTPRPGMLDVQTPWSELDDVFYEARGATWALAHLLRAVEIDFAAVLEKKNATVSLRQIIRELDACQQPVWSPVILNGDGFGLVANHSLVMASYISRANAAIIDLKALLTQG